MQGIDHPWETKHKRTRVCHGYTYIYMAIKIGFN